MQRIARLCDTENMYTLFERNSQGAVATFLQNSLSLRFEYVNDGRPCRRAAYAVVIWQVCCLHSSAWACGATQSIFAKKAANRCSTFCSTTLIVAQYLILREGSPWEILPSIYVICIHATSNDWNCWLLQPVSVHVSTEDRMDFINKNFLYRTLEFKELVKRFGCTFDCLLCTLWMREPRHTLPISHTTELSCIFIPRTSWLILPGEDPWLPIALVTIT